MTRPHGAPEQIRTCTEALVYKSYRTVPYIHEKRCIDRDMGGQKDQDVGTETSKYAVALGHCCASPLNWVRVTRRNEQSSDPRLRGTAVVMREKVLRKAEDSVCGKFGTVQSACKSTHAT